MKPKDRVRSDALWPWYVATAIYLAMGAILLYDRRSEIGPLLEPVTVSSGRLPLNSIGDVLAGFFAPLAFLWLFVATLLQRTELKLQREELSDTRQVLDEQRLELQRSAQENNLQTEIMQKNLETTRSRETFDEFNIELYYIVRSLLTFKDIDITINPPGSPESRATTRIIATMDASRLSISDISGIDGFIEDCHRRSLLSLRQLKYGNYEARKSWNENPERVIEMFSKNIFELINKSGFQNNKLIDARNNGLQLFLLVERYREVLTLFEDDNRQS